MDNVDSKNGDQIFTPVLVGLQKFNIIRNTSNGGIACSSPYPKTPAEQSPSKLNFALKRIEGTHFDKGLTITPPLPAVSANISKKHRRSSHLDSIHLDNMPLLSESPSMVKQKSLLVGPLMTPVNNHLVPISPLTLPQSMERSKSFLLSPPRNPLPLPLSPLTPQAATKLRATHIKDFSLIRTIGTGFFGRVYFAKEKQSGKYVALKVLNKQTIVKLKQVEHIFNEKKILQELHSPFCLKLLDSFHDSDNIYLSMEYVCGGELFTYLRSRKRFRDHVARFYAAEVVLALDYMHSKDIIYRDLKPENLLLDSRGHIKLCDYGFAKVVKDVTWTLCGTPDYLAPEIIQSRGYGKAVDWWALGVLIFEMLAGYPPFYHKEQMQSYQLIVAGVFHVPSHVSPAANDLIHRLLRVNLSKRYGNLKSGVLDIQLHPWFTNPLDMSVNDKEYFDWARLSTKNLPPPIKPVNSDPSKTTSFDDYPEISTESFGSSVKDSFHDIFKDF